MISGEVGDETRDYGILTHPGEGDQGSRCHSSVSIWLDVGPYRFRLFGADGHAVLARAVVRRRMIWDGAVCRGLECLAHLG